MEFVYSSFNLISAIYLQYQHARLIVLIIIKLERIKSENRTVQHGYDLLSYFIYIFLKNIFTRDVTLKVYFPL